MCVCGKKNSCSQQFIRVHIYSSFSTEEKKIVLFNKLSNTEEPSWTGAPNMYMKSVAFTGKEKEKRRGDEE